MELKRKETETEEAFLWRVGQMIDLGQIESWQSVNDIVNSELGLDEEKWRDSSTYRKRYQAAKKFYDNVFSRQKTGDFGQQLERQRRELERAKIAFRDERKEWNKQNYIESRIEEKLDNLEESLSDIGKIEFPNWSIEKYQTIPDAPDMIVCLSDMHIGQTFSSAFGEYNSTVAQERLNNYADKVIAIGVQHKVQKIYVDVLGDQISGNIHSTIQVSNRENVIDQIKLSAEMIASFCYKLSEHFDRVFLTGVNGNHSRLVSDKELAIHDERLDNLIIWIVEKMTDHIDSIVVLHNNIDSGISDINVRGKHYISVHGDYDIFGKNGASNLVMMLGFFPDCIISGHKHYSAYDESSGIPWVQSGTLVGSGDSYTIEKRLTGKPSQTVLICNKDGIDCIYNIKL